MVDITEVAERIYRFETPIPGLFYIPTVYLIHEEDGVMIEPGPSAAAPVIQEVMEYLGMKDIAWIMPTHIHMDHAGGAGMWAQRFPRAKVLIHPRGVKHAVDPSRLIESTKTVWGDDFENRFGPIIPIPEYQIKVPEDGEIILVRGRELQIIYAPGHAPHHMAIFDRSLAGLFCGEAVGLPGYQIPTVIPPSFDLEAYLDTTDKLRRLEAQTLFYSHGGAERDPDVLISRAEENARVFGEMVLEGLKHGDTWEDISHKLADYISQQFGLDLDSGSLVHLVAGYAIYFQNKGLA